MSMIKEAQQLDETVQLIVERCSELSISAVLLEDLGGTMLAYIQDVKGGRGMSTDVAANLANVFAFAELIGAIRNEQSVKPNVASGLLNIYKTVKPSNSPESYGRIMATIDNLGPKLGQAFRTMANNWGNQLSALSNGQQNPARMEALASKMLAVATRAKQAAERLQSAHGDAIVQSRVQSGKLARELGV